MLDKIKNSTMHWLKKPYNEDGSAIDWFLFIGLMIVIAWIWSRILERV